MVGLPIRATFISHEGEVQLDEKWAFVGEKQQNCDPTDPDDRCGDYPGPARTFTTTW
jgi:hypothetical protein